MRMKGLQVWRAFFLNELFDALASMELKKSIEKFPYASFRSFRCLPMYMYWPPGPMFYFLLLQLLAMPGSAVKRLVTILGDSRPMSAKFTVR